MTRLFPALLLIIAYGCSADSESIASDVPSAVDTSDVQVIDVTHDVSTADAGGSAVDAAILDSAADVDDAISDAINDTSRKPDASDIGTDTGAELDPVCLAGQTTCAGLTSQLVCAADGLSSKEVPCDGNDKCVLGICSEVICDLGSTPVCQDGHRFVCGALGTALVPAPCPAGLACNAGECVPVTPNVILIVDTSGSMSLLADAVDTYPSECTEDSMAATCPPWDFPTCDVPEAPQTRIGRVKVALTALIESPAAQSVRLALQRFPQTETSFATCKQGHYKDKGLMTGDQGDHDASLGWFGPNLSEILAVPFSSTSVTNDLDRFLPWFDFTESMESTGQECIHPFNCPSDACIDGECHIHTDPELRGIGATPLGRSLFYAGEYLRKLVVLDGRECTTDADCPSPHHTCVTDAAGLSVCSDPMRACRPNVIIVFTDGEETINVNSAEFFNPVVQAKRLHYGLGCTADVQCSSGATCKQGHCVPEPLPNAPLVSVTDTSGFNYPKGYDLRPVPVTVHVVDASGVGANAAIAAWGGGQHVSADLGNLEALFDEFVKLLDPKSAAVCQP